MGMRKSEMEEIDRWCDEREEAVRRARRRVGGGLWGEGGRAGLLRLLQLRGL